ncbi:MAG: hypothetical protein ACFB0A_12670 [Croceivirga sp.]
MKAYKIRSLFYLTCFIFAAVVYYQIEEDKKLQDTLLNSQTADLQIEDETSKTDEDKPTQNNKK